MVLHRVRGIELCIRMFQGSGIWWEEYDLYFMTSVILSQSSFFHT